MPAPGQPSPIRREMPADFVEFAKGRTYKEISRHYNAGDRAIARWLEEAGLSRHRKYGGKDTLPDNLEELAKTCGMRELARVTGWGYDALRTRIIKMRPDLYPIIVQNGLAKKAEEGRKAAAQQKLERAAKRSEEKPRKRQTMQLRKTYVTVGDVQTEAKTMADKAMRWLQRYGVCYPMRVHNPKLTDYIFKGTRMSAEAIIREAQARGWDHNAWRF